MGVPGHGPGSVWNQNLHGEATRQSVTDVKETLRKTCQQMSAGGRMDNEYNSPVMPLQRINEETMAVRWEQ